MTSPPSPQDKGGDVRAVNLGLQLRIARTERGLSLRELARRLGVSPSFLSQIENGKAQPSVATLYSMAQMLEVSIDHLFVGSEDEATVGAPAPAETIESNGSLALEDVPPDIPSVLHRAAQERHRGEDPPPTPLRRADLGSMERVWQESGNVARLSVTSPGSRTRLVMDSGVVWEQLATNTAHQLDFMEITYPPGATSTSDERMLRHDGFEYGYLLEGELEVTLGFETFILHAGEAMGLNSSIPHLFRNKGAIAARGIWFVHHQHD